MQIQLLCLEKCTLPESAIVYASIDALAFQSARFAFCGYNASKAHTLVVMSQTAEIPELCLSLKARAYSLANTHHTRPGLDCHLPSLGTLPQFGFVSGVAEASTSCVKYFVIILKSWIELNYSAHGNCNYFFFRELGRVFSPFSF